MQHNSPLLLIVFLFTIQMFGASTAEAFSFKDDLVYGASFGFGGSGIDKDIEINASTVATAKRSESPGMIGLSIETYINEKWSLALSHRRGFRFGPFSMGVGFTGLIARRYFLRPIPFIPSKSLKNTATVQTWVPYVGLGAGVAIGTADREDVFRETVSGSGVFFGLHLGVDYQLYPNIIFRPEFFTSGTFMSSSALASSMTEYGLVLGVHFRL